MAQFLSAGLWASVFVVPWLTGSLLEAIGKESHHRPKAKADRVRVVCIDPNVALGHIDHGDDGGDRPDQHGLDASSQTHFRIPSSRKV